MQGASSGTHKQKSRAKSGCFPPKAQSLCGGVGELLQEFFDEDFRGTNGRVATATNPSNLLEAVEEDQDEVRSAFKARDKSRKGLSMGKYTPVVLAHSQQLDSGNDTDQCPTPWLWVGMPRGCLQNNALTRLQVTAHCGSARWVVWKGLTD